MNRSIILFAIEVFSVSPAFSQISFTSRGVGGGGALFAPSINPLNHQEYYVACDMSGLYHTINGGNSYETINFQELQAGPHASVRFTNDPMVRYCIGYAGNQIIPMKSTDMGTTWNSLPGNPDPLEETLFMEADFNNPDHIIIAYHQSIYFSGDGGNLFSLIHTALNSGNGILTGGVFFEGNQIYIGTNDGLLVSANGGSSFSFSPSTGIPAGQAIYSFTGGKKNGITRLFCLTADAVNISSDLSGSDYWGLNQGIYSMDYGTNTWIPKMTGLIPGTDFPMFVRMAQNDINVVYLAGSNNNSEPEILKTTNAGNIWIQVFLTGSNQNIATGWCGSGGDRSWGYAECAFGLTVASNDPDVVIFSDYGFVHRSINGGSTWIQAYLSPADQNSPGTIIPAGKSYHSAGMENTTCWQIHWSDANTMFSCFSDIRGCRSTDGGQSWNFNYSGHQQNTMYRIAMHNNGNLYAATATVHDIYQSTRLQDNFLDDPGAGGKIIFSVNKGSTWLDLHDFGMPVFWISIDPNNPNRLYASVINHSQGLGGIYMTNNLLSGPSSTWIKLSDPPRTEGHPACIEVLNDGKMVCTYSGRRNPAGVFTASSGVFLYDPVLNSWSDVSHSGMYYWSKDIVIDQNDPAQNTWYVGVFNGWGGPPNGLGGLYRTTNRGSSWNRIYNGSSVTSLSFRPGYPGSAFITTEQNGLLFTNNLQISNPTFFPVLSYYFRQPERVFFNPYQAGEMWVSSFGYGMQVTNLINSGIDNAISGGPHSIVSPNPNQGSFSVSAPTQSNESWSIEIFNTWGQKLLKKSFRDVNKIQFEGFEKGVFLIKVTSGNQAVIQKLIIN